MSDTQESTWAKAAEELARKKKWQQLLEPVGFEYIEPSDPDAIGDPYGHPDASAEGTIAIADHEGSGMLLIATNDFPPLRAGQRYTKLEFYAAWHHEGDKEAAVDALTARKRKAAAKSVEFDEAPSNGSSNGHVEMESAELEPRNEAKFEASDLGNAERFVRAYGADMRYCHLWGKWLTWQEWGWDAEDNGGAIATQIEIGKRITVKLEIYRLG